jgi:isorenieratene synthase
MKNLFDNFGVNALGVTKREVADGTRGSRGAVEDGQRVVVVGGGLAGVAAACVLAERGVKVTLLEKDPQLGGRVSAWTEHLPDGTPYQMERGFHAFFRQYYQLRSLLRRVDPNLDSLTRLVDYPVLGPDGDVTSFTGLPKTPPLNVVSLLRRTDYFKLRDLIEVDGVQARAMLRFDPRTTYAEEDDRSAGEYLDGLRFRPRRGRCSSRSSATPSSTRKGR